MLLKIILILSVLFTPSLGWCAQPKPALKVVATFSILADWVQQVGGRYVQVQSLVGPNQDTHTFEPTPQDNQALVQAELIVENGFNFENWLNDLYQASGSKAPRSVASDGIISRTLNLGKDADPHFWHDARRAIIAVGNIQKALSQADPAHARVYQARARSYIHKLEALDRWVLATIDELPVTHRQLVTVHNTLGYFAERYECVMVGSVLMSATTEAADPSAKEIANLVLQMKYGKVKAVLTEQGGQTKLAESLATETGTRLSKPLYTDALGVVGSGADTYIRMMHHNVAIIVNTLK